MIGEEGSVQDCSRQSLGPESPLERPVQNGANPSPRFSRALQRAVGKMRVRRVGSAMSSEFLDRARSSGGQSAEGCRDLYDRCSVGYVTLDGGGFIVQANLTAVLLLGCERESLLGTPFPFLVCSQDRDAFDTYLKQVRLTRSTQTGEVWISRMDGSQFPAQLDTMVVPDVDSGKDRFRMVITDLTDRGQAGHDLPESDWRFRKFFQKHSAVMLLIEPETGQIVAANQSAQRYYGYGLSELSGMTIQQINTLPPDQVALERKKALSEECNSFMFWHRLASGEVRAVEVHSSPLELDGRQFLFSIVHDITDCKRTEAAVSNLHGLLTSFLDAVPDLLTVIDRDFRIQYSNFKGHDLIVQTDPKKQETCYGRFKLLDRPCDDCSAIPVFETGRIVEREMINPADGRVREVRAFPVFDDSGNVYAVAEYVRDITDRKEAEEKLRASEEKFRLIFEASPDAISLTREADSTFLDVNKGFLEISGHSRHEILASTASDLHIFADPDDRLRIIERLRTNGLVENYDAKVCRKDGSTFSALISAVRVTLDGEPCVLSIARSIEDLKKAQASLKSQRDLLAAVFETAPFLMMVVNEDLRVKSINRAAAAFSNRTEEELLGLLSGEVLGCIDAFHGSSCGKRDVCDTCPIRTRVMRTFLTGEPIFSDECAFTVRRAERDAELHLLVSTALLKLEGTDAVLITLADITDRKRGEEEKALLEKQLLQAQKMESIGTLAGGIAHDFNNLLQVILGYSDMLLYGKQSTDPDYEALHAVRQAGRDCSELAKRILAFSQRLEPNARPIDLNQEIKRLERLVVRTIPKMIRIELDLAEDLMSVNADPGQVEQTLLNLVVNAQHAMPDGGRLAIRTANVMLDEAYCRTHLDASLGEHVLIEVSDTGHGIDREIVDRIFEPFFTTKGQGQGTGLGLAMVYGIVKSHRGHVTCHSRKGAGATFSIYFPAIVEAIAEQVPATREMPAFGTESILFVDDESLIVKSGKKILARAGYSVMTAANGREALQVYGAHRDTIHLVILDMIMPEMGGKQCLHELLNINPHVKVVIASGYTVDSQTKETIEPAIRGFVTKPYDAKELLATVRKVLDEP